MKTKPGEVWLADLGIAGKVRPVVIVSREDPAPPRALVVFVPLTTKNRGSAYEMDLGKPSFLNEFSAANVQGIGSLPTARLQRKLGDLSGEMVDRINQALRFALNL